MTQPPLVEPVPPLRRRAVHVLGVERLAVVLGAVPQLGDAEVDPMRRPRRRTQTCGVRRRQTRRRCQCSRSADSGVDSARGSASGASSRSWTTPRSPREALAPRPARLVRRRRRAGARRSAAERVVAAQPASEVESRAELRRRPARRRPTVDVARRRSRRLAAARRPDDAARAPQRVEQTSTGGMARAPPTGAATSTRVQPRRGPVGDDRASAVTTSASAAGPELDGVDAAAPRRTRPRTTGLGPAAESTGVAERHRDTRARRACVARERAGRAGSGTSRSSSNDEVRGRASGGARACRAVWPGSR